MKKRDRRPASASASAPGLVLDVGALRALEAHDVALVVALGIAHRLELPIRIPAAALAQVLRGGPRSAPLARLLRQSARVVPVDERSARQVGELRGRTCRTTWGPTSSTPTSRSPRELPRASSGRATPTT
jgi:hypothetical protein